MIAIQNYEAIIRRDLAADDGWYVLSIKKGYHKYYINLTKAGEMLFKTCELSREMNGAGLYILKCGTEYCTLTKPQLSDMNYVLACLTTFVI
jgi:hypothetical protein